MKKLTIITLLLIVVSGSAQRLDGKWWMTKEGDTYVIPENLILEINSDSLTYFSFDKIQSSLPIKIEGNKIEYQKHTDHVEFINDNRIKITGQGKLSGKDSLISTEYVRLMKTKTVLSRAEIESLSFKFKWNDEKFKVEFNKELGNPQVMKMMGVDELTKIHLEKIDSTYFVSIFDSGERESVFPIKEVSKDEMIVYGTPRKPYEITGEKIE